MSATAESNYLYRGFSISDGQPTLTLALAYDGPGGLYGGASAIGEATWDHGAQGLGHGEYLGYAIRPVRGPTLDFGVNNLNYRVPGGGDIDAAEVYAGLITPHVTYYLHYAPDYFRSGVRALYGEVNGVARLPRPFSLFGHLGVLTSSGGPGGARPKKDLRIGIAAAFRRGEARLGWTATAPGLDYPSGFAGRRGVFSLAITRYF